MGCGSSDYFKCCCLPKLTGPTYPKKVNVELNGEKYKLRLLRSHGGKTDAPIELEVKDGLVSAKLYYKCFPKKEL